MQLFNSHPSSLCLLAAVWITVLSESLVRLTHEHVQPSDTPLESQPYAFKLFLFPP